ncbi:hypothetical protein ABL78_4221 [Leptomonas seymouri]|uniref:Uncharacterized protein n=1 Tax=Leptomonas seymouri TaxID=5684 RepID=A0A0N1I3T6_LEPSE|nr:hypothetical protein ABL78_4221 [Leptomonas seymouri]|eukprot:KPI86705.1 hypothetical protein ABL78_4221 [Leptomonas seymouri]
MAATASSASAEALYHDHVWPALWDVLKLPSSAASSPSIPLAAPGAQSQHHRSQLQSCRVLQHAVTHALVRLLGGGAAEAKLTLHTLEAVSSQLLLHTHGAPLTKPLDVTAEDQRGILAPPTSSLFTPSHAAAAVEVERLYALVCTTIQLSAQADVALLNSDRVPAVVATGPPATAIPNATAAQLPAGVTLASSAVVAGIYGVTRHLAGAAEATAAAAATTASGEHLIQPLWFTFLFVYLQQLSAHTPKDTAVFARFLVSCGKEYVKRIATDPLSSDDENDITDSLGKEGGVGVGSCPCCQHKDAHANELAALRAWSQVSPDLLKDTIDRTRFRRAALLFKSFAPHMTTQAPTLMFLVVDLLCEYSRSWEAWMQSLPAGSLDVQLAEKLANYSVRSIAHDTTESARPSSTLSSKQQWQQCQCLIQSYGDRLMLLLSEGTPHAHLVATALYAVLSSLYILPHTRLSGVCAADVSGLESSIAPLQSTPASKSGKAATPPAAGTGSSRGKRDEEAGVLAIETAYRLPRRGAAPVATAESEAASVVAPLHSINEEARMSEAEWRLRHYTPFGQLLAHVHILELQKVHLFSVAATQIRVGRTAAHQTEQLRLYAMTALFCGVASWDLALLLYHFAGCPLSPFRGPDASPSPPLPSCTLARYTAAVQHYVDQSRAELIVNTSLAELNGSGLEGGLRGDSRRGGARYGGGDGGSRRSAPQQRVVKSMIPSRGELQTSRFIKMVNPDSVLLSWRAHLAAAEMALTTSTTAAQTSSPFSSPTPQSVGNLTAGAAVPTTTAAAPSSTSTTLPASNAGSPDTLISPCCFIRDLLIAGQYTLAAAGMRYLSEGPFGAEGSGASPTRISVLLPPRRAFPQNISVVYYTSVVLRRWMQRWEILQERQQQQQQSIDGILSPAGLRDEMVSVLHSLLPLLSVVQSYLAHQALLTRLVVCLVWLCKAAPSCDGAEEGKDQMSVWALVEQLLIYFIMPCLRVLPPALAVYDALDDVVEVFTRFSYPHPDTHASIPYGDSPAAPFHVKHWLEALLPSPSAVSMYHTNLQRQQEERAAKGSPCFSSALAPVHPHDALLRKEREALLSQSLKRLNAENIAEYHAALRPVLHAEPLLVAHRLFVQAIGYSNNFLDVHTHLLHGLPRTILTLITQQGMYLMQRYAAEEKVTDTNGESRTAILSTFLATLWRDNVDVLDGTMLVRRAELALRSNSAHDIVLGVELFKALLAVMAYRTLEHEEKYSAAQLQVLAVTPSTTSFFGRGAMTSFRVSLWKDTGSAMLLHSPVDVFVKARRALMEALKQPCAVPLHSDDEAEEGGAACCTSEEKSARSVTHTTAGSVETRLILGQLVLVHLCRLQSRIYELQRDLDGGAELILLSSAKRFNTINDMLIILEELLPAPQTSSVLDRLCALVRQVALPQVALYVETQQRRKFEAASKVMSHAPSPLRAADVVYRVPIPSFAPSDATATTSLASAEGNPSVVRLLQYFTAAHFEYTPVPYNVARQEWEQCMQRAQHLLAAHRAPPHPTAAATALSGVDDRARARRADSIISWLKVEHTRMEAEELAHRHLLESSTPARAALLDAFLRSLVPANPADAASVAAADDALIDFAASYLLPRAVLNLREAATVAAFFTWIFQQAESGDVSQEQRQLLLRRATDLALTLVSAVFTYFVAYTDGECKRIGYVLQRLLEIPALSSQEQQRQSVAARSPELFARLHQLFSASQRSEGNAAGHASGDGKDGAAAVVAPAAGASGTSPAGRRGESGASDTHAHRSISSTLFSHFFLSSPLGSASQASSGVFAPSPSSAPSASSQLPPPPSLLDVAVARGLVAAETKTAKDAASTPRHKTELEPVATSNGKQASAATGEKATAHVAQHPETTMSAIPLQFEAYVCRALVQLLTHDGDVPAYAQRNQFLVLEQLDKTSFPSTLCAVDVLARATEPHASKSKSYYALASAVLKHLRLNRRRRREAQHVIAALSRGESVDDAANSSPDSPTSASVAAATASTMTVPESLKESATAFYAQWRLREHYMKQLMQAEVAQLLSDQQVRQQDEGTTDEEEEDDERDSASNASAYVLERAADDSDHQQQQASQDKDEEHEAKGESEVGDSSGDSSFDEEEDDEDSDGEDVSSGVEGCEEEDRGSHSGASDEEGESGTSQVAEDDSAGGLRKRPREE